MEKHLEIRPAGTDDIATIKAMAEVVFTDTYKDILSPEQLDYMMDMMYSEPSLRSQLTVQKHKYYIAEYDGTPSGYVSVSFDGEDDGVQVFHLQKIYVMPGFQGKGIGKALFGQAESFILSIAGKAAVRMELNVNRNNKAKAFYEHMGMVQSRQGDFPIGNGYYMNDFIMSKALSK